MQASYWKSISQQLTSSTESISKYDSKKTTEVSDPLFASNIFANNKLKKNGEKCYISFHEAYRKHIDEVFSYNENHLWMTKFIVKYEQQHNNQ